MTTLIKNLKAEHFQNHKNPFKTNKIERIRLSYGKVMFEKHYSWVANVYFKDGDTSGEKRIEVTDLDSENSFVEIVNQVQQYIHSLK